MVAQTAGIVPYFFEDAVHESSIPSWVGAAAKHHILPDTDAQLVTQIIKCVVAEVAASPDAYHVVVSHLATLQKMTVARFKVFAGWILVNGNPVGSFGKEADSIDGENEGCAECVFFSNEFKGAEAEALFDSVKRTSMSVFERAREVI